jgi:tellurite methyltransferase
VKTLPDAVRPYRRTAEFSESSVPPALRGRHTTKPGVWARIHVLEGSLRYRILAPEPEEHVLTPDSPGIVAPEVPHEVEPVGRVRFFVEFLR